MIVETAGPRCLDLASPATARSDAFRCLSDDGGGDSLRPVECTALLPVRFSPKGSRTIEPDGLPRGALADRLAKTSH